MTQMLVAVVLVAWGISGIFDKKAVETASTRSVFAAFHLFNLPMCLGLIVVLSLWYPGWRLSSGTLFWEAANAVAAMVALVAYFHAMSKAEASLVLGISAGYPIVGQILAVALLGEPVSTARIAGAVLVSAGVAAVGFSESSGQRRLERGDRLAVYGCLLLAVVLWGMLGIFEKKSLEYGQPLEAYLSLCIWKLVLLLPVVALFRWSGHSVSLARMDTWKYSWLSAALVAAGNICYVLALTAAPAGYMIVITACYPIVMYGAALMWLGESFNRLRVSGIVVTVCGALVTEVANWA